MEAGATTAIAGPKTGFGLHESDLQVVMVGSDTRRNENGDWKAISSGQGSSLCMLMIGPPQSQRRVFALALPTT